MTAEERAAIDWLENLSRAERSEYFMPAAVPLIGFKDEDRLGAFATLKDDHEGDQAHCVACNDPNAVVVA